MGRRAVDLTAPVPILGVPALVGVRGWRTIAGDRTGGALLQSWGTQCSIGVQTSPAVGRPPVNSMQLPGALAASDSIQMSNSSINNDSEYKEILKSDQEKRAILKLKTRSSKTKKEVTFQTVECEASRDVTCSLEISQTHCQSKETKGSLPPSQDAGVKSKLRPPRYSNGSVVDSEAIGGISVDGIEAEPVASSVGKKQAKLQSHHAEKSGRPLLLSGVRPFRTPQKICGQCGGRQSDAAGIFTLDQKSACHGEKAVNPLLTTDQFPLTEPEHKIKQQNSDITGRDERTSVVEVAHSKIGTPLCPLHSRSNLAVARKALFTQQSTFVSAKTINVTKATTETKPSQHNTVSQASRLHLTPQMATATKSNIPHTTHTYPQNRGIPQRNLTHHNWPMSVCVSVHAAPDTTPPSLYTTATGAGTISITNALKRTAEFNAALAPAENMALANAASKNQSSVFAAKVNADGSEAKPVSLAPSALEAAHKLETDTQFASVSQSCVPPCSGYAPHQRSLFTAVMDSSGRPAISSAPQSTAPHVPLSTPQQSTWRQNSDKITHYSTKPATSQCYSVQPKCKNAETALVYTETPNAALNSSNPQNSNSSPLSGVAPNSTIMRRCAQATALRNSSTCVKSSPPTAAASDATTAESQAGACVSAAVSLQSADETQHNRERGGNNTNPPGKGSDAQASDESGSGCVASAEENSSTACPAVVSELATLPEYHQRDTDASHSKSDITTRSDSHRGGNKINANPIKTLLTYESKPHENSSVSQVTSLRNYISLIKPSGSCLHACTSTERRCGGYSERAGQCAACPPANTDQQIKKAEKLAARPADVGLDPSADKHTNPRGDANGVKASLNQLTSGSDTSSLPRSQKDPELSSILTPPVGDLYSDPGCNSTLPSFAMDLASRPRLQLSLSGLRPCPGNTGGAHSHPADVARLLPPSPQCCKSATLQQKLENVEASLAANKDRITTLLNIIHDLEMSHTPSSGRRCNAAGQDLRNCATCQKTACIVYSVEYDFRQQERHLLEVLNRSPRGNKAFSTHLAHSLNISMLRNTIKNLTKSKVKSKKLCKTLFKWLPRKIQQR
ncbi:uncharacterized protein isoform X1 [Takifugu rubripes]|uniref:Protein FAM196B n=1 Tax=Takifugu rubripes TaxID=31033 RepID=A0A674PDP9_TAKRU|nr:uncharacterized protein insyn2b isoform X1 [Takifugu rubripes]